MMNHWLLGYALLLDAAVVPDLLASLWGTPLQDTGLRAILASSCMLVAARLLSAWLGQPWAVLLALCAALISYIQLPVLALVLVALGTGLPALVWLWRQSAQTPPRPAALAFAISWQWLCALLLEWSFTYASGGLWAFASALLIVVLLCLIWTPGGEHRDTSMSSQAAWA